MQKRASDVFSHVGELISGSAKVGDVAELKIDRMRRALDEFYVRGVSHNVPFLAALMAHPRFRAGKLTTNFISEEFNGGFTAGDPLRIVELAERLQTSTMPVRTNPLQTKKERSAKHQPRPNGEPNRKPVSNR